MFRDMMIHDLDMACWLLDEEPVGLFAAASVIVDPAIGKAGDVDTAVVTLCMKSGALCQIANTRRAIYGYDQRIEVLGSKGWASGRERR
jgi:myo-inositol 2-dehydrogenase/D-chiro-inositol 1-dehydrogenase